MSSQQSISSRKRCRPNDWISEDHFPEEYTTTCCDSSDEEVETRPLQEKNFFSTLGFDVIQQNTPFLRSRTKSAVKNYAGFSLAGYNPLNTSKLNQDALLMAEDSKTNSLLIACMDGHGKNGELVSNYVKNALQERLFKSDLFSTNIEGAIRLLLCQIELELFQQPERYGDMSGTTLCLAVIRDRKVTIANIGDSRIIVTKGSPPSSSSSPGSKAMFASVGDETSESSEDDVEIDTRRKRQRRSVCARSLSVDHKPDVLEEYQRVLSSGGRVFSVRFPDGTVGPPRVWLGDMHFPGLAMSRSVGDFIIQSVGVISTPDVFEYDLELCDDSSLIIATDGIWDFVSNQEAAEIIADFHGSSNRAVAKLIATARGRWERAGNIADDITACVIELKSN